MVHEARDLLISRGELQAVVKSILGWHCPECGEVEFDTGEGARYAEALATLRAEAEAQQAADLARIRKKLRLTQAEAAKIAGGGKNAFSRYEKGNAKPVAAVVNLFRLLEKHPELLNELRT